MVDTILSPGALFIIAIGTGLFTRQVARSGLSRAVGMLVLSMGPGTTGLL